MTEKNKSFIIIFSTTISLYLICDFLIGALIVERFYWKDKEDFRINHKIYHHTIKPNFNGSAFFGGKKYKFCSNSSGFKSSCKNYNDENKIYDIAFIGDSFTEGLGLEYEKSFVGIIDQSLPNKKVANLAVSGYSPSIYFIKIYEYLKQGYHFNEVIIYVDINDVFDEANRYKIENKKVVPIKKKKKNSIDYLNEQKQNKDQNNLKKIIREIFPFSYENLHLIKMFYYRTYKKKIFPYVTNLNMSAWTYKNNLSGYGNLGVKASIEKTKENIYKLMNLLDENNISYSIGVYPYPQTLFHDSANSQQVKIWSEMCENRCKYFFNNFNYFFEKVKNYGPSETYYKYYIYRDIHFNENGHKVIAKNFLDNYKN